ncbi:MAG: signal peptide peptidase SppA [Betaproteobacteria bacterium]|nr:MAG: signal peptide peptidase SppA [Betaproteobacteria bacterium]
MSKLLDIVNAPWALEPAKLEQLVAIYCGHLRGEKVDLQAIEAQLGRPLANEPQTYEIVDGVAILPMEGMLAKRMNLFSKVSGGTSTELLGRELRKAQEDPRVHAMILAIDSPGGQVDGTQALADQVFGLRASGKPVVALADGAMTSGAYWIGSAAAEIYIAGDTVITGSIGVATQHVDVSRNNEKWGITVTDIYAGKYKRIASENKPLSEEGRAHIQALVDKMYGVFVDQVARHRGTEADTVLKNMAEGRLFVGREAIAAGLVDGVSTLDQLIADLVAGRKPAKRTNAKASAPAAGAAAA